MGFNPGFKGLMGYIYKVFFLLIILQRCIITVSMWMLITGDAKKKTDFLLSQIVMLFHENICFSNKLQFPSGLKIYYLLIKLNVSHNF